MKSSATDQKLRGGYYTPAPIADFLSAWAISRPSLRILEPSCGNGAILSSALRRLAHLAGEQTDAKPHVVGVEIDAEEAAKARTALRKSGLPGHIVEEDFFSYALKLAPLGPLFEATRRPVAAFDVVVGNPPFIRYQNFPEEYRKRAFAIMERHGLHPNRLTNSWVPFLVTSCGLLGEQGRLAMVLPAELLQVNYAAEIRQFLSHFFNRVTIITFRNLVFATIQQEVVLLLAEKASGSTAGIRVIEVDNAADLSGLTLTSTARPKRLDHSKDKWTQYFLSQRQIDLLRRLQDHPGLPRLGSLAEVDVGVVTGDNDFFALSNGQAVAHGIRGFTKPLVTRSAQLTGLHFSRRDWRNLLAAEERVLLFSPEDNQTGKPPEPSVGRYLKYGIGIGTPEGYKCRIRRVWYVVPSQWVPDAFFTRQVHAFPRLVLNGAGATATDTLHRVRFRDGTRGKEVAAAAFNSLTFAFAETMGRSYGGGVLTFEPTEVEALPLPLGGAASIDFSEIDRLLRDGQLETCLELTDRILLVDALGLSASDVRQLRRAYHLLRDRRVNRRRKTTIMHPPTSGGV